MSCSKDSEMGWTFGPSCKSKCVKLLSSCDDVSPTKIPISCDEYERLSDVRRSSTDACIAIVVNPSNGGQPINGFGRDWFFDNCY
ncbi:hypothetical protein MWU50_06450 [Flavobacteriaceae bacterium S0862]|nr:hypothetical protein [Flavobacteriaceae bacterium S0862]